MFLSSSPSIPAPRQTRVPAGLFRERYGSVRFSALPPVHEESPPPDNIPLQFLSRSRSRPAPLLFRQQKSANVSFRPPSCPVPCLSAIHRHNLRASGDLHRSCPAIHSAQLHRPANRHFMDRAFSNLSHVLKTASFSPCGQHHPPASGKNRKTFGNVVPSFPSNGRQTKRILPPVPGCRRKQRQWQSQVLTTIFRTGSVSDASLSNAC